MSERQEPLLHNQGDKYDLAPAGEASGWSGYNPFRWRVSRGRADTNGSSSLPDCEQYQDVDSIAGSNTPGSNRVLGTVPLPCQGASTASPQEQHHTHEQQRMGSSYQPPSHFGGLSRSLQQQQTQTQAQQTQQQAQQQVQQQQHHQQQPYVQEANPYIRTPFSSSSIAAHPPPATFIAVPAMLDRGYHHRQHLARSFSTQSMMMHHPAGPAALRTPSGSTLQASHFQQSFTPSASVPSHAHFLAQPGSWSNPTMMHRASSTSKLGGAATPAAPEPQQHQHHYLLPAEQQEAADEAEADFLARSRSSEAMLATREHSCSMMAGSLPQRSGSNLLAQRPASMRATNSYSMMAASPTEGFPVAGYSSSYSGMKRISSHVSIMSSVHDSCAYPICLICLEPLTPEEFEKEDAMKLQCLCLGEVSMRHRACAVRWSQVRGNTVCDICNAPIANLPPVAPRPPQQDDADDRSGQLAWEPPAAADYIFDFIRVTWVAMILCILFWDCDMASAFLVGGMVGLLYTSVAKAVHDCRRRRGGGQEQQQQRQGQQHMVPAIIMV